MMEYYNEIAAALLNLRRNRETIRYNHEFKPKPRDVGSAYTASMALADMQNDHVGGWKLGATTHTTQEAFNTKEVYFGPLLSSEIFAGTPIFLPEFRGEAEISLRLACDLSAPEAATVQLSDELFLDWAPSIEAPWSVFRDLPKAGLLALLSDRCAAGALFLGRERPISTHMQTGLLQITVDGEAISNGCAERALLMPVVEAGVKAIQLIGRNGASVRRGQWIATGGITECLSLPFDKDIELWFDGERELIIESGTVKPHADA